MTLLAAIVSERLDWFEYGISSVNRTGAFAACVSVGFLALAAVPGRVCFALGIIGSLIFAYFMSLTMSRGAFLGWLCGSVFFIALSFPTLGRIKSICVAALIVCVLGVSFSCGTGKRIAELAGKDSVKNDVRSELYLSGLKMLSDAPEGWNMPAQDVYHTWYQGGDRSDTYMSLINSHLQFMTEHGIAVRIAYLSLWVFALMLSFPKIGEVFNAAASAVFICTFVSAIFSNVLNYWVVWIPFASFLFAAAYANCLKLKSKMFWTACFGIAAASYAMLHAVSSFLPRDVEISKRKGDIIAGTGRNKAYFQKPAGSALGSSYGRELKAFLHAKKFSVVFSETPKDETFEVAVISSDFDAALVSRINAEKLFILNAQPLNPDSFSPDKKIEVILGSMSDWRRKQYWTKMAEKNPNISLKILPGAADYITDWPRLVDGTFDAHDDESIDQSAEFTY